MEPRSNRATGSSPGRSWHRSPSLPGTSSVSRSVRWVTCRSVSRTEASPLRSAAGLPRHDDGDEFREHAGGGAPDHLARDLEELHGKRVVRAAGNDAPGELPALLVVDDGV